MQKIDDSWKIISSFHGLPQGSVMPKMREIHFQPICIIFGKKKWEEICNMQTYYLP